MQAIDRQRTSGWQEHGGGRGDSLPGLIADAAEPLPDPDDAGFGASFDRFADARVVLLGEASHGTSEFYRARAAITRHLVEHRGFRIVAAEADWPDMATLDRQVRDRPPRVDAEPPFQRFPTWMWRNREFAAFVRWLREANASRPMRNRAGLFGLDLYSLGASMRSVIDYLDRVDPDSARIARERYACLAPWTREPAEYGWLSANSGHAPCEDAVVAMLVELLQKRSAYLGDDGPEGGANWFDATQNARLVRNAEKYYRAMYQGAAESWNQRDRHMFETLRQLLDAAGPDARAVAWAHNSHIGDARATGMGRRGELNLGQLCREHWGADAALVGFGTHAGTVAAAADWDAPMQVMPVRRSLPGSHERLCHDAGDTGAGGRFLLDLRAGRNDKLRAALDAPRLERFIGVIYRPETERASHYVDAVLARQFDAYAWFDQTRAVEPTGSETPPGALPDTYPFGL